MQDYICRSSWEAISKKLVLAGFTLVNRAFENSIVAGFLPSTYLPSINFVHTQTFANFKESDYNGFYVSA